MIAGIPKSGLESARGNPGIIFAAYINGRLTVIAKSLYAKHLGYLMTQK